jgi:hypothetical protein
LTVPMVCFEITDWHCGGLKSGSCLDGESIYLRN